MDKLNYRITYRILNDTNNTEYKEKIEIRPDQPFDKVIRMIARKHEIAAYLIIPVKVSLKEI